MSFIAIIGKSNVGKTTLVNELTKKYPQKYRRAKSYTTRMRRDGEDGEYIFVSHEELSSMLEKKKILYIDSAYGNEYAMDHTSFDTQEFDTIKEIHPANVDKIRQYADDLIVIYIINKGFENIRNRIEWDDSELPLYDGVFYNSMNIDLDVLARELHRQISAIKLQKKMGLPLYRMIDKINKEGYDLIAEEFNDYQRITTANFHEASRPFFQKKISQIGMGEKIMEAGSGNGWLSATFGCDVTSVDISSNMYASDRQIHTSISDYDSEGIRYDKVFASLCDPFFYPIAIAKLINLLKPGGELIISLPSFEWSQASRGGYNMTTFVNKLGQTSTVYSFTYEYKDMVHMGNALGYIVDDYYKGYVSKTSVYPLSPAIAKPIAEAHTDIDHFSIVECYTLRRIDCYDK